MLATQLDRMTRLQLVTAALSGAVTRAEVTDVVLGQALAALGARAGSLVLLDETAGDLVVVGASNYSERALAGWARIPLDASVLLADVVRGRRPLAVGSRAELERRYPAMVPSLDALHHAWASVPLVVDERVLGAIGLSFADERAFADEELEFMLTLAHQCAHALARAERRGRTRREAADAHVRVSHELRTPMATLAGGIETLRQHWEVLDDETRRNLLEAMSGPAQRLGGLIDDLLAVAEIELGVFRVGADETDLAELLRMAATEAALSPRHHVTLELGDDELPVRAEPRRLYRALSALVDNAIAFSPAGSEVAIRAGRVGSTIVVSISDEGPGIAEGARERIFEPFRRLDHRAGGTGIGLYLARAIVELLGGHVRVAASGEQGSTFAIELPAAPR